MPDEDILDNPFDDIDQTGISDEDIRNKMKELDEKAKSDYI